ncbi:cellulose binding domain-containing protein, partial [Cellvibrio mixtus]|uniref:cellulose binding domain-containing protein n=1 Tax=Cellvibrio mixtus TaxID=39650 RepID=UPI000586FF2B
MKKLLKLSMLSSSLALGIMAAGGVNAQGACSVDYTSVNNWGSGAQYKVTFTNTGAAKTSWELCWTFAGSEVVNNLWDGVFTQTGKNVCVKNAPYNPNLAANGTASFGFLVNNP